VTRIWTAVGTLNSVMQSVALLPDGDIRLIKWRPCRPNATVDGVTNSLLKQSAAIDQRSQVARILRAWRQLHRNHAGPERFDETRDCLLACCVRVQHGVQAFPLAEQLRRRRAKTGRCR
jgi:hypothetical protein